MLTTALGQPQGPGLPCHCICTPPDGSSPILHMQALMVSEAKEWAVPGLGVESCRPKALVHAQPPLSQLEPPGTRAHFGHPVTGCSQPSRWLTGRPHPQKTWRAPLAAGAVPGSWRG